MLIFAYGTLKTGFANYHVMESAHGVLKGKSMASGYGCVNTPWFPYAVKKQNGAIRGEVFEIGGDALKVIDSLEGYPELYVRELTKTSFGDAWIYYSEKDLSHDIAEYGWTEEWGVKPNDDFVYYFVYGSNLSFERFHFYIVGGVYPLTHRWHSGCEDQNYYFDPKTPIKYAAGNLRMFFGGTSVAWDGMGVSFVEETKERQVLGRLYKVTKEQFYDIQRQEGTGDGWYGRTIQEDVLGTYENLPIWTMTCLKGANVESEPSQLYRQITMRGLLEAGYSISEIQKYLEASQARSD